MTKLRDCRLAQDARVPEIDAEDLEPLWIDDYYDGPLSGALSYQGQLCWYLLADSRDDSSWRYWLIRLTPAQRDVETRWHELFVMHVGTHWDHPYGVEPGRVRPPDYHHRFYDLYNEREPLALEENEVIGWFRF